jgi:hypothetical protein
MRWTTSGGSAVPEVQSYGPLYLDSCVYLDGILGDNPSRLSVSKALLERAQVGDYELYASTFVYAEVGGNQLIREGQVKGFQRCDGDSFRLL